MSFDITIMRTLTKMYRGLPVQPFRRSLGALRETYLRSRGQRRVRATVDGITYDLDLGEMIDRSVYLEGCFEPTTTAALKRLCRPGMTVFDIGANIGCHTLLFAKKTGPGGRVVAFEPMPWPREKLRRNVALNSFAAGVLIESVGLSDEQCEKEVCFRTSWQADGASDNASLQPTLVTFETLDEYVSAGQVSQLDLLKIDVDGYELKVLRGAERTLRRLRPIIVAELGPTYLERVGDTQEAFISFLDSCGYGLYSEVDFTPIDPARLPVIAPGDTINVVLSSRPLR